MSRTTASRCACAKVHRAENHGVATRLAQGLGWLGPGALLILMPKCPVCVAGYIAVLTGVGISLPAATAVRYSLLILCIAALAYMAWRRLRHSTAALSDKKQHPR